MIATSTEYKSKILEAREFIVGGTITLANSTIITLSNDNVMMGGLEIEDATSDDSVFSIGSAIIGQCKITLDNSQDQLSQYDFIGAIVKPKVGLKLSSSNELFQKGVYTVDSTNIIGSTIVLTCLDNMDKLDTPFNGDSPVSIIFPCTTYQLLYTVCTYCGVSLGTSSFLNNDFVINARPSDNGITCREIVSWIAQIACSYVRCDKDGQLKLDWYDTTFLDLGIIDGGDGDYDGVHTLDGGDFTYSTVDIVDGGSLSELGTYHHLYMLKSTKIATDDVVITGIKVIEEPLDKEEVGTYYFPTIDYKGYVIEISRNKLIQIGSGQTLANSIGSQVVGLRFRPCEVSCVSDPSREAGDVGYVTDRKGNTYKIFLSSVTFKINGFDKITCDAETPSRNSSTQYFVQTKTIQEARKIYENTNQKFKLFNNGLGFYNTEVAQEDGSIIFYMHDKPLLEDSVNIWRQTQTTLEVSNDGGDTWIAGYDVNGNALFNVLNAVGINCEWLVVGSEMGGFTLSDDGFTSTFTETFGPFTQSDKDYIRDTYILGGATPTEADLLKYDLSRDGSINSLDVLLIERIMQGLSSPIATYVVTIRSNNPTKMIELTRSGGGYTSTQQGMTIGTSAIEASQYKTNGLFGAIGTFTSSDGKTITVTNGIITSIV